MGPFWLMGSEVLGMPTVNPRTAACVAVAARTPAHWDFYYFERTRITQDAEPRRACAPRRCFLSGTGLWSCASSKHDHPHSPSGRVRAWFKYAIPNSLPHS